MFLSIKAKIVTIYSLVMISFVFLFLLIIFVNEHEEILDLELAHSTKISQMHAKLLNEEMTKYISMLTILATDPEIKLENKPFILNSLSRLMQIGGGQFINAVYIDNKLNIIDFSGRSHNADGSLFSQGAEWLNKKFTIIASLESTFSDNAVIFITVPIWDAENKWMGNLAAVLPLASISDKLSKIKLAKHSYAWLTDANDLIISHPDKRFEMNVTLKMDESESFPGFHEVTKKTKRFENGYGRYTDALNDEAKIVTFSNIESLPGWHLFITTKESDIFKGINATQRNVLITSLILTGCFLLLINQLSNKITDPIVKLTNDVKKSIKDKRNYLKVVNSNDEIGQLSKAFYDNAQKISQHTTHLQKEVDIRTKEILEKNLLLREQNDKLEGLASKDPLTLLYNRRAFSKLVENELSRAKRHYHRITLVILDIDNFKDINDKHGHHVGDDVLYRFAKELLANTRKENIICRWGGEEFVILIPEATSDMVYQHIETIRIKISEADFSPVNRVSFSAGMATMITDESFSNWFQRADSALYKAKVTGRNKVIKA